jgi:hypothetical protein
VVQGWTCRITLQHGRLIKIAARCIICHGMINILTASSGLFVALLMSLRNISSYFVQLERGLIALSVIIQNMITGFY